MTTKPGLIAGRIAGEFAETYGLVGLVLLTEKSGAPVESITGRQTTFSATPPTWVSEEEGAALNFASGSNTYAQLRNILGGIPSSGCTVMARFKPKATLVAGGAAWAVEFAINHAAGVGSDASGHVAVLVAGSGGTHVANGGDKSGTTAWTNQWVTAANVIGGTPGKEGVLYENGLPIGTGWSDTGDETTTNGYADLTVGCNVEAAGTRAPFNGSVAWAAVFDRALTADEIFSLYANDFPYCLFKPRRLLFAVASAGGDATGTATGTSAATGVGASTAATAGSSAGTSTASGVGASTAEAVGTAAGASSVSGVGQGLSGSVGSASGTSTVAGVGASLAASVGSAAGTSTVDGVGASNIAGSAVGTAAGTSTVSGVGASIAESVGSASGSSNAVGISSGQQTSFTSQGSATTWNPRWNDRAERSARETARLPKKQARKRAREAYEVVARDPEVVKALRTRGLAESLLSPMQFDGLIQDTGALQAVYAAYFQALEAEELEILLLAS